MSFELLYIFFPGFVNCKQAWIMVFPPHPAFLCLSCVKHKLCICTCKALTAYFLPYLFSVIIKKLMPIWLDFCISSAFSNQHLCALFHAALLVGEVFFQQPQNQLIFFIKSHLMSSSPWCIHRNKSWADGVLQTVPSQLISTVSLFPSSVCSHLLSFVLYFGALQGRNYLFALYFYMVYHRNHSPGLRLIDSMIIQINSNNDIICSIICRLFFLNLNPKI